LTVLKDLQERLKFSVSSLKWADQEERIAEAVELVVGTTKGPFAFEHTRVEAFEGQIGDGQRFLDIVWELEAFPPEGLRGPLKATFALFASGKVGRGELATIKGELARWLLEADANLRPGAAEQKTFGRAEISVRVEKREGGLKPLIFSRWLDPSFDLEAARRERISLALSRKLPKLREASRGGAGVLILESNDVALSNRIVICETVISLSKDIAWIPEYVFVLETENEPWLVCPLKEGEEWWPTIGRYGEEGWYYRNPFRPHRS
jgi:hypothetical protein